MRISKRQIIDKFRLQKMSVYAVRIERNLKNEKKEKIKGIIRAKGNTRIN